MIGPGTYDESDGTDMIKRHPIAVLLHASSNLFAVSPAIIRDLRFAILAMIAKWLLVIICLALIRLQTKPDQAPPAARPVSPNSDD
jgi:hypothetical protein